MNREKIANLGKLGRDAVTGFEGIITATATHLFGCDTYYLQPKVRDGKRNVEEAGWFDCGRIQIIGAGVEVLDVQSDKPGGDELKPVVDR